MGTLYKNIIIFNFLAQELNTIAGCLFKYFVNLIIVSFLNNPDLFSSV